MLLATLCFIQEVLASHISKSPVQRPAKVSPRVADALAVLKIDVKAFKMALYGLLVSAPLGHYLVGYLQRVFAGRTSNRARAGQILANNLLVAPIQATGARQFPIISSSLFYPVIDYISCQRACRATVLLASMAVINGAKTVEDVIRTVKSGFMSVIRVQPFTVSMPTKEA